jgi:hypothetical protein
MNNHIEIEDESNPKEWTSDSSLNNHIEREVESNLKK